MYHSKRFYKTVIWTFAIKGIEPAKYHIIQRNLVIYITNMSENISSYVTAKYSEVDLSKKKNRKPRKRQDEIRSNDDSMYDVLQRENPLPETLSVIQPKSNHGRFKSSASPLVKVGLAVTAFLAFMALAVLTVLIIIIFLKVSALEAAESNSSSLQYKKRIQKYIDSYDYINSTLDPLRHSIIILNYSYQQNFSFLENIYHEITSLNYSLQTVANNIRNDIHPISYNQTCPEIAKSCNDYYSGEYILKLSAEAIRTVYCDMTSTLGGSTSGWMRIAKLDVNNCPQGLNTTIHNSVNTCIRSDSGTGCTEIRYFTNNVRYSNISGAVRAFGLKRLASFRNVSLNSNYLDGVSVSSDNEHVWSFAAGCLCGDNNPNKPRFVGNDYTCDVKELLCTSQQCGSHSSWFFKTLLPTTADITVRVCTRDVGDFALTQLELYIQ